MIAAGEQAEMRLRRGRMRPAGEEAIKVSRLDSSQGFGIVDHADLAQSELSRAAYRDVGAADLAREGDIPRGTGLLQRNLAGALEHDDRELAHRVALVLREVWHPGRHLIEETL